MNIVRIVYEHGVTVQRSTSDTWHFQSVKKQSSPTSIDPNHIPRTYQLRPVLLTYRVPVLDEEITFVLPTTVDKKLLEITSSELTAQVDWKRVPSLFDVFNLTYIVSAVIYHCKQLAEIYSNLCKRFANAPTPDDSDKVIFSHHPEGYYEFDALITAAKRAYDTTRYPLWKFFGPGHGSVPASFIKTVSKCDKLPSHLAKHLQSSWSQFGHKLKDYRDCIQHYVPLDFGRSSAIMNKLQGDVWSASLLIPDNPEVKSKSQFQYKSQIDALTFGWNLTNEVLEIASTTLNATIAAQR